MAPTIFISDSVIARVNEALTNIIPDFTPFEESATTQDVLIMDLLQDVDNGNGKFDRFDNAFQTERQWQDFVNAVHDLFPTYFLDEKSALLADGYFDQAYEVYAEKVGPDFAVADLPQCPLAYVYYGEDGALIKADSVSQYPDEYGSGPDTVCIVPKNKKRADSCVYGAEIYFDKQGKIFSISCRSTFNHNVYVPNSEQPGMFALQTSPSANPTELQTLTSTQPNQQ